MANLMKLPNIGIIENYGTRFTLKVVTRDGDKEYFGGSYVYDNKAVAMERATKKFKCKVIEDKTDTAAA